MIITKMALPRRTFLRGIGATIALPLLDAMVPALSAASTRAAGGVSRMGFFYVPNGMFLPNFHPAGEGGTSFQITPILKPMEPLREHMIVLSGLANMGVISNNDGGGVHTRAHAGWLNGVLPKRTEGADITAGKTIDQYAADKLGADTPLRSLELTTESNFQVGNCEIGADGLPRIEDGGNVLRPCTSLKISLRLPPLVDGEAAARMLKALLERDPPYGARVTFTSDGGATGWNAPPIRPWLAGSVNEASTTYFGKPAMYEGTGGTIPFMAMLGERFPAAQFLVTGVLGPGSNAHGPNEFLHLPTGVKVTACVAQVLADHGRMVAR